MFRPLWGGIADTARRSRRRAARRGRRRRRADGSRSPPAAAANPPPTRTRPPAPTRSRSSPREFPAKQRLGETTLLRLGVRNSGAQDAAGADRDDLGRRQGRRRLLAALRLPRPRSRAWPSPTGPSGCSRPTTRRSTGSAERAGAETVEPEDLRLRPAEAGRDDRSGLEAERGQDRQLRAPLRGRRRPRRHGEGGDRAPGPKRAAPSRRGSPRSRRKPKSPTAAKSSKSARTATERPIASVSVMGRCAASRSRSSRPSRSPACPPAAPAARGKQAWRRARVRQARRGRPEADRAASTHPSTSPARPASRSCCSWSSRAGTVRVLRGGHKLGRPFLDIRDLVSFGGERGLLSIAFPPDYKRSRRFYVYYTDRAGNIRIDEFKRTSATRAARGSRRAVIEIPHPVNANHNGGQLQFLGDLLYFGTGDGGSGGDPPNNAQNRTACSASCCGSTRDPRGGRPYSSPPTTPSSASRAATRSTATACATRSASPSTRRREAAADRDRRRRPEQLRGARLHDRRGGRGAPTSAGTPSRASPPTAKKTAARPTPAGPPKPIFAYPHSRGGSCAIIGGYVVRDPRLPVAARALHLRRPLRGRAAQPRPPPAPGEQRPHARPQRRHPQLLRRRRPRPHLRRLARRPGLPAGPRRDSAGYTLAGQPRARGRERSGGERNGADEQRRRSTAHGANGGAAETIDVLNPANGRAVGSVAVDSPQSVAETVARVRANQPEWEALGIEGRYRWLGQLRDWILDNHERIADTMQAETGKVRADAAPSGLRRRPDQLLRRQRGEVPRRRSRPPPLAAAGREEAAGPVPAPPGGRLISPWNFPLILALGDAIPALLAGTAVVIKPSEFTPLEPDRGGRGLEGGDRRPRRLRLRERRRRDRRRPGRPRRLRPVHRLRPDRPQGDGARRRDADPGQPRARRQGPDDRPPRRRPRPRRQRRGLGRDRELRPDLHVGRAHLRRGAGLRRVRRQADRGGRQACARAPTAAARQGRRRDDLAQPDRDRRGPRRRRARQGRPGADRRQARSTAPATGSSRPCWPTSTTR